MKKALSLIVAVLVVCGAAAASLAFPQGGGPAAPADPQEQQPPSPEAVEQARKSIEEARKIVVAKVNGVEITMDALVKMMNRLGPRQGADPEAVKREALDRLVFQELAFQRAKALGVAVEKEKIDSALGNFKSNMGGPEEFAKFLDREAMTEEMLRVQVERSMTLELLFAREVYEKVAIPEDKVKEEYEREKNRYVKPEKITATDVVVLKKNAGEGAQKKAEDLLARIKAEKEQDPWKLVLDGTFIVRHYQIRKEKDKELHEAAVKLKPGELSGVIAAADGYHILKLREYAPERYYTFEESRGSIEGKFRYEAQEKRIKEWKEELKKGAAIEILEPSLKAADAEKK